MQIGKQSTQAEQNVPLTMERKFGGARPRSHNGAMERSLVPMERGRSHCGRCGVRTLPAATGKPQPAHGARYAHAALRVSQPATTPDGLVRVTHITTSPQKTSLKPVVFTAKESV